MLDRCVSIYRVPIYIESDIIIHIIRNLVQ